MRRLKQFGVVLLLAMNAAILLAQTETFPRYRLVGGVSGVPVEVSLTNGMLTTTTAAAASPDVTGLASTLPRFRLAGGTTGNLAEVDSTGHLLVSGGTSLATTDTPQFAALGLGTTAPASGMTILSTANPCLAVGPNGTTTPTLSIDCSVASAASGVQIVPAASGSGVTIQAIGGASEPLNIRAKGSGLTSLDTSSTSGVIRLLSNGSTRFQQGNTAWSFTPGNRSSGTTATYTLQGGTDTALTAATEAFDVNLNFSQTKQHASNTTVAMQRSIIMQPPTLTFASNGGVYTAAATLAITGPPTSDANNTITTSSGLYLQTRALTGVTTAYSLNVEAPTTATTNYAATFSGVNGVLFVPPATQTIAEGDIIVANACGGVKNITAAGAVTTSTVDTITTPSALNTGCQMTLCNVGAQTITLDKNANILLVGGANVALLANSCINIEQSTGAIWRQTTAQLTAT